MLNKIKIGLAVIGLLGVGIFFAVKHFMGEGSITVIAPMENPVTVMANGKPLGDIPAGGNKQFPMKQGEYEIALTSAGRDQTHKIDVDSGNYDQVLPVKDQCFVVFEVAKYVYEIDGKSQGKEAIEIEGRYEAKAFDRPSAMYFSYEEMPNEINEHGTVHYIDEFACADLKKPDPELVDQIAE
jgi:hypothetical protein